MAQGVLVEERQELAHERVREMHRSLGADRATGDGDFVWLPGEMEPPAFRDTTVKSGQRYRYVITAVDRLGNESGRSEPAEAEAP